MATMDAIRRISEPLGDAIQITENYQVEINDPTELSARIEEVVRIAALGTGSDRNLAQWLVRECAQAAGANLASIHDFYLARGRGEVRDDFTVPAINLRAMAFHAARSVFRAALACDARALIFEIARSEIGYTDQPPTEYAASVLGAAIAEGYKGPVFIQGDHFQVGRSRYEKDPDGEVKAVCDVSEEAIAAGFFNIDIDTSTLVDLDQETIPEQQRANYTLCSQIGARIRAMEPDGVTVSLGGEIGEVGGHNSTEPELRAFMEGFEQVFSELAPGSAGLSKISIQTGTSHGGVVLPDGSIAKVSVDFDTLSHLSKVAKDYGMGGAVQHGASTLPEEAFTKFVEAGALEVHLATGFQNILFEYIPEDLRAEMYAYLDEKHASDRKPDQTDDQFYYTSRKRAIGPFKRKLWDMTPEVVAQVQKAWENQFNLLFERLNITGTRADVLAHTSMVDLEINPDSYLTSVDVDEDISDLAD